MGIEYDPVDCGSSGFGDVPGGVSEFRHLSGSINCSLVIQPKSHGVTDKVLCSCLQTELGVHVLHRALVDVES